MRAAPKAVLSSTLHEPPTWGNARVLDDRLLLQAYGPARGAWPNPRSCSLTSRRRIPTLHPPRLSAAALRSSLKGVPNAFPAPVRAAGGS